MTRYREIMDRVQWDMIVYGQAVITNAEREEMQSGMRDFIDTPKGKKLMKDYKMHKKINDKKK